ncbi:MAG: capsular polysaccharide biosynthesis protein [Lachnospiraceae bacterium]|nr:capsular polysaccharide biosynthesis protein [Lachnospiraceae bacterium]
MIDIHSHILPGIDDGSSSTEESAALLSSSAAQGIRVMAATSHFYAQENSPEEFLKKRLRAAKKLKTVLTPDMPRVILGAEVQYFTGISRAEMMEELRLMGTRVFLLEMPFSHWSKQIEAEVAELQRRESMQVVLAHVERYLDYGNMDFIRDLMDKEVLIQSNASFFLEHKSRKKALHMLKNGEIHLLGSDCHSVDHRPQQLGEALEVIEDRLGREAIDRVRHLSYRLLEGGKVIV